MTPSVPGRVTYVIAACLHFLAQDTQVLCNSPQCELFAQLAAMLVAARL